MLDLEPIKAREAAATVGPWEAVQYERVSVKCPLECYVYGPPVAHTPDTYAYSRFEDVDFMAESRSDIPDLIAEVERQRVALMEIRRRLYEDDDLSNDVLDAITRPFSPQAEVERLRGENQ